MYIHIYSSSAWQNFNFSIYLFHPSTSYPIVFNDSSFDRGLYFVGTWNGNNKEYIHKHICRHSMFHSIIISLFTSINKRGKIPRFPGPILINIINSNVWISAKYGGFFLFFFFSSFRQTWRWNEGGGKAKRKAEYSRIFDALARVQSKLAQLTLAGDEN